MQVALRSEQMEEDGLNLLNSSYDRVMDLIMLHHLARGRYDHGLKRLK